MNRTMIIVIAVLLAALMGGGAWYYSTRNGTDMPGKEPGISESKSNDSPGSPADNSSKDSEKQDESEKQTYQVSVYFSKRPESDNDPSAVFPVKRTSPDLSVATFAIKELLKGPTAEEAAQGYFRTATLREGGETENFTLTIKDGTATLQFLKQFDHRGVVADGQADSILNATLKQFPEVNKVVIINAAGNCEFDLSGMNKCLE